MSVLENKPQGMIISSSCCVTMKHDQLPRWQLIRLISLLNISNYNKVYKSTVMFLPKELLPNKQLNDMARNCENFPV